MNIRLKCGCGARFLVSDQMLGRAVKCPKCAKGVRVPETLLVGSDKEVREVSPPRFERAEPAPQPEAGAAPATWQAHARADDGEPSAGGGWWKWLLMLIVLLVPVGVVGTLIVLPMLRPKDPREVIARQYLDAIRREDWVTANRLSVLTAHPRLTGIERVALTERQFPVLRGKFLGLAEFHARIDKQYRWNPDRGRFEPKDELGLGLGVLSELEKAKKKAEEQAAAAAAESKRKNKNPEDQLLDSVLAQYGAIADLAQKSGGLLSSQKLGPTYEDLLNTTDVQLSDVERQLALHYKDNAARWDQLLQRSFLTLPGNMDFEFYEVEIQATIRTEGQSFGEPGRPLTLRLVRFVLGSIDTGWRVWGAK
jgi:hypothetical protein